MLIKLLLTSLVFSTAVNANTDINISGSLNTKITEAEGSNSSYINSNDALALADLNKCFKASVQGTGKPVILIPGFSNDNRVWLEQEKALKKGYQVHSLSLSGFAGTDTCDYNGKYLNEVTRQILTYIEHNQLNEVNVIGHSMGGLIAMNVAIQQPNKFSNIITIDGLPFIGPVYTRSNATTVSDISFQANQMRTMYKNATPEQITFMTQQGMQFQTDDSAAKQQILEMAKKSNSIVLGDAIYDVMATDLRKQLHKISASLLLIGASGGFNSEPEHTFIRSLYKEQLSDKKDASLIMNTDAKHFIMFDDGEWLTEQLLNTLGAE